jgi:hypothetical protein
MRSCSGCAERSAEAASRPAARPPEETGHDIALRRDLRLRKAVEVIAESAVATEAGKAAAREDLT